MGGELLHVQHRRSVQVGYAKRLADGGPLVSNRTMRMLNEVPGIAAIIIVVMVIVRPF